jgi:hypothetical protein
MLKSRRDYRQLDFWAPILQQVQLKSLSNPHQYAATTVGDDATKAATTRNEMSFLIDAPRGYAVVSISNLIIGHAGSSGTMAL